MKSNSAIYFAIKGCKENPSIGLFAALLVGLFLGVAGGHENATKIVMIAALAFFGYQYLNERHPMGVRRVDDDSPSLWGN